MKSFFATAFAFLSALSLGAAEWVADPFRAAEVSWPKYPVKGKDCWLMLSPAFRTLQGVKDMEFVREAGFFAVNLKSEPYRETYTRIITVKGLTARDAKGETVALKVFELASDEPGVIVQDGVGESGVPFKVLSAPYDDVRVRYKPARGRDRIVGERPFVSLSFLHVTGIGGTVAAVEDVSAPFRAELNAKSCQLLAKEARTEASFDLVSRTPQVVFTGLGQDGVMADDLARAPFSLRTNLGRWTTVGAPATYTDKRFLEELKARYPETFLGVIAGEWDSNFLQKLTHGTTAFELRDLRQVMTIPTDRNGMVDNLRIRWDNFARLNGGRLIGLSGGISFMHYGCDFGSRLSAIEMSGERVVKSQRQLLLHTMAAGRQFGVPTEVYIAYFSGAHHPDSRLMTGQGTDWGQAPSLSTRNLYTAYYMGANYFSFESQPFGQVKPVEGWRSGEVERYELTANGEAMRDIHAWMKRPEGVRGEFYAPILVLQDRRAGDDQAWTLEHRQAAFYGLFDATDGDCMNEYLTRAVSAPGPHADPTDPAGGSCHFNSTVGNVVMTYHANPLVHGDVTVEQLEKYPVVIVSGDHVWSENLARVVMEYVSRGGTLVITAGQSAPFDATFLGYELTGGETASDGLYLANGKVRKGVTVLKATSDDKPLVVANRYGAGQVDFVTSPFFRRVPNAADPAERFRCPPQLKELLETLQDEILPVKVRGDCEFTVNRAPDGSWKYILVNNLGSIKDPKATKEIFVSEYARDVTLTLPAGATAREVRLGVKGKEVEVKGGGGQRNVTFTVPPAGVLVVRVKGVNVDAAACRVRGTERIPTRTRQAAASTAEVKKKNDGYRYNPAVRGWKKTAPALVGEWLAKNDYRDTSGNRHDLQPLRRGKFECRHAHFEPGYTFYNGTLETWVKIADKEAFRANDGKNWYRGGVFYLNDGDIYVMCRDGYWSLVTTGLDGRRLDLVGPKVKEEWTHLCVTFDHEVMRFYVNGRVAVGDCGVVRSIVGQGVSPFIGYIDIVYGSADPSWGKQFRGEMKGLRYYSRTFTPEEVATAARQRERFD